MVTRDEWSMGHDGVGWLTIGRMIQARLNKSYANHKEENKIVTRLEYAMDPMAGCRRNQGDARVGRIQTALDSFGCSRTKEQKLWHFWFLQSLLERIYEDEWDSSATKVLRQFGINKLRSEVAILASRRCGKSWSVGMFVVAALINIPGIKIAIFSTGRRASSALMGIVMEFINKLDQELRRRICKNTEEQLFIAESPLPLGKGVNSQEARDAQRRPGTSTLYSYPSNVKSKLPMTLVHKERERY